MGSSGGRRVFLRVGIRAGIALALLLAMTVGPNAGDASIAAAASPRPMRFGIYPGGPVGSVGKVFAPLPENTELQMAALNKLKAASGQFVVRLYTAYYGDPRAAADRWLGEEITRYTDAGFGVDLVARYRPSRDVEVADAIAGYQEFVSLLVSRFGPNPRFVGLQVTNEANVDNAPDASDGAYRGVNDALVRGVIAAKETVRRGGFATAIGFNWSYQGNTRVGDPFWRELSDAGGREFAAAVDWVGLDSYPAVWDSKSTGEALSRTVRATMTQALRMLRTHYLPLAGIGDDVALQVAETGYPTGPRRSAADQQRALRANVAAVLENRAEFNITDFRWFDLRDSNSSDSHFESQYGLLRDDYSPKPAFADFLATLESSAGRRRSAARATGASRYSRARRSRIQKRP